MEFVCIYMRLCVFVCVWSVSLSTCVWQVKEIRLHTEESQLEME